MRAAELWSPREFTVERLPDPTPAPTRRSYGWIDVASVGECGLENVSQTIDRLATDPSSVGTVLVRPSLR